MRSACFALYAFFGLTSFAFGDVVSFDDYLNRANEVQTKDGNTVRISSINSLNTTTKTADAVIDAKDKFGNDVKINRTLKIIPSKFKNYATLCLRSPVACGGAAALSYGVTELMGWYFDAQDGTVTYELPGIQFPGAGFEQCPSGYAYDEFHEFSDSNTGYTYSTNIRLPHSNCAYDIRSSATRYRIPVSQSQNITGYSNTQISDLYMPEVASTPWGEYADSVAFESYRDNVTWDEAGTRIDTHSIYAIVRVIHAEGVYPDPLPGQSVDVSPEMMMDVLTPESLIMSEGLYPDVWEPTDSVGEDEQPTEDPSTDPDLGDFVGGTPSDLDLVGPDIVSDRIIDISQYFSGDSFIDASCPQPTVIDLPNDAVFEINYSVFCDYSLMIHGFVVLAGMLTWLMIVWRGIDG